MNDDADFVEDDDNAGYIDDGLGEEEGFSDEYDQADHKSSKYDLYSNWKSSINVHTHLLGKRKRKNGTSADGKDKQAKKSRDIASMFSKSASRKPAPSTAVAKKEEVGKHSFTYQRMGSDMNFYMK